MIKDEAMTEIDQIGKEEETNFLSVFSHMLKSVNTRHALGLNLWNSIYHNARIQFDLLIFCYIPQQICNTLFDLMILRLLRNHSGVE